MMITKFETVGREVELLSLKRLEMAAKKTDDPERARILRKIRGFRSIMCSVCNGHPCSPRRHSRGVAELKKIDAWLAGGGYARYLAKRSALST